MAAPDPSGACHQRLESRPEPQRRCGDEVLRRAPGPCRSGRRGVYGERDERGEQVVELLQSHPAGRQHGPVRVGVRHGPKLRVEAAGHDLDRSGIRVERSRLRRVRRSGGHQLAKGGNQPTHQLRVRGVRPGLLGQPDEADDSAGAVPDRPARYPSAPCRLWRSTISSGSPAFQNRASPYTSLRRGSRCDRPATRGNSAR